MNDTREPTQLRGLGAFGMIPEWVLLANISSTAKVLFGWMACRYASRATWACWPGQQRLADDLRLSVRTVNAAIKELSDIGALTKRQRVDTQGGVSTNYYQLMFLAGGQDRKKTADPHAENFLPPTQKTSYPPMQKTADKPEVLEPEVLEPEGGPPLIESPLRWHRRHGGHIGDFCDWMCLPQDMVSQFATRAGMTDTAVIAWAQGIRETWQRLQRIPAGSMYEFWNERWKERINAEGAGTTRDSLLERAQKAVEARKARRHL